MYAKNIFSILKITLIIFVITSCRYEIEPDFRLYESFHSLVRNDSILSLSEGVGKSIDLNIVSEKYCGDCKTKRYNYSFKNLKDKSCFIGVKTVC